MSIKIGDTAATVITFDGQDVKQIILDGDYKWCKPFSYTQGTLPENITSLTCVRSMTSEPTASGGTLADGATVYYGDKLYWTAIAATGYNASVSHGSSNRLTVTGDVNGVSDSGLSVSRATWGVTIRCGTGVTGFVYQTGRSFSPSGPWASAVGDFTLSGIDYDDGLWVQASGFETGYTAYSIKSYTRASNGRSITINGDRIRGNISQGTLPTGVSSITCYRKAWDGNDFSVYSGSSIYYGDQFYWTATADTDYNAPTVTYGSPSNPYTWTGSSGSSITSVEASGLAAGSGKSYNVTVTKNTGIDKIYYKVNGALSFTEWTSGTVSANYDSTVYWYATAEQGFTGNAIGSESSPNSFTVTGAGSISPTATLNSYTLTINVSGGDYGDYSITRTPNGSYGAPGAETWSNVANGTTKTIYYGDTLTTSHSAKPDTATTWNYWPTVTVPAVTSTGAATSGNITVTNRNSSICTLYYQEASSGYSGTSLGATAPSGTRTKTGLSFSATYYCYATKLITRTGSHYTYSDSTTYDGTNSVTDDVTSTFSFSRRSVTDSESKLGYSGLIAHTTAAQSKYQVVFTCVADGSWSPSHIDNVPYGTTWTTNGCTVTLSNDMGSSTFTPEPEEGYAVGGNIDKTSGTVTGTTLITAARSLYRLTWTLEIACGDYCVGFSYKESTDSDWSSNQTQTKTLHTIDYATTVQVRSNGNSGGDGYNYDGPYGTGTFSYADSTQTTTVYYTRSLKSYTITLSKPTYGSWDAPSDTAYHGDYIEILGNTVTCKAGGSSGSTRWTHTLTANDADNTYTYSASITTTSFTVSEATPIETTSSRTHIAYTITWKYLSAYPDTWTTAIETYAYGATPSRSDADTVTKTSPQNERKVFSAWDDLSTVTSDRTITATYTQQYHVNFNGVSWCSPNISEGWQDSGTVFTWTATPGYAFDNTGKTTQNDIVVYGGNYSAIADYKDITVSSTNCSADVSSGYRHLGDTITWSANENCSFSAGSSRTATTTASISSSTASYSADAKYYYVTISGTNCVANAYSTGYIERSTNITFTANSGYIFKLYSGTVGSSNYTVSANDQATVFSPGQNISKTAVVKKLDRPYCSYDNDSVPDIRVVNYNPVVVTVVFDDTVSSWTETISGGTSEWIHVDGFNRSYWVYFQASGWIESDSVQGDSGPGPSGGGGDDTETT